MTASGRYVELSITAIMHSTQLCTATRASNVESPLIAGVSGQWCLQLAAHNSGYRLGGIRASKLCHYRDAAFPPWLLRETGRHIFMLILSPVRRTLDGARTPMACRQHLPRASPSTCICSSPGRGNYVEGQGIKYAGFSLKTALATAALCITEY
jgi:hypothetical protein